MFNVEADRSSHSPGLDPGSEAARPLDHEHAQADAGDGARRLGAATPRAAADRGDAAVRRPDARADGRHGTGRRRSAPAAARAARERPDGRDRAGHRRPRSCRCVQRPGAPPCVRRDARGPGRGQQVRFFTSGKKAQSTVRFRRLELGTVVDRLLRPPRLLGRTGDRPRPRRGLRRRRGRPRPPRLQRVRLAARAEGDGERGAAGPDGAARGRDDEATSRRHPSTSSSSPSRGRSSSGCSPSTSRPSSTGPCSSRPPRSRAPG